MAEQEPSFKLPIGETMLMLIVGLTVFGLTFGAALAYSLEESALLAGLGGSQSASGSQGIPVFILYHGNGSYSIYSNPGNIPGTLHLGNTTSLNLKQGICYQATVIFHVHPIDVKITSVPTDSSHCD